MGVISVIRLDVHPDSDPVRIVVNTLGRESLALADQEHAGDAERRYWCSRGPGWLDVVTTDDAIATALLRHGATARIVTRRPLMVATFADDRDAERTTLPMTFRTPTHFEVADFDHLLPEAPQVFGSLYRRWTAAGLPEPAIDLDRLRRIPCRPGRLALATMSGPTGGKRGQRGFIGHVEYDLRPLRPAERAAIWQLARFGWWRGVGRHTGYGHGRIAIDAETEAWAETQRASAAASGR